MFDFLTNLPLDQLKGAVVSILTWLAAGCSLSVVTGVAFGVFNAIGKRKQGKILKGIIETLKPASIASEVVSGINGVNIRIAASDEQKAQFKDIRAENAFLKAEVSELKDIVKATATGIIHMLAVYERDGILNVQQKTELLGDIGNIQAAIAGKPIIPTAEEGVTVALEKAPSPVQQVITVKSKRVST